MAVDFKGFRRVVNALAASTPTSTAATSTTTPGPAPDYADIDIQPGYQRLCGQRALDYVRYRHGDSDFVRAARQQSFLRDAKDQVGTERPGRQVRAAARDLRKLDADRPGPAREQGRAAPGQAGDPLRREARSPDQVPGSLGLDENEGGLGSYVTATPYDLEATRLAFLAATKEKDRVVRPQVVKNGAKRAAKGRKTTLADFGLVDAKKQGGGRGHPGRGTGEPVVPDVLPAGAHHARALDRSPPEPRVYTIRDRADKPHEAYRLVFTQDEHQRRLLRRPGHLVDDTRRSSAGGGEGLRMRGRDYRVVLRWQNCASSRGRRRRPPTGSRTRWGWR